MAILVLDHYGKQYKMAKSEEDILQICPSVNNVYVNSKYTISDADYLNLKKNIKFVSGVQNNTIVYQDMVNPDSTKEAMDFFIESKVEALTNALKTMSDGTLKTSYQNSLNTLNSLDTSTFTYPIVGGIEKFLIENGVPNLPHHLEY